jgi:hypothetical protein
MEHDAAEARVVPQVRVCVKAGRPVSEMPAIPAVTPLALVTVMVRRG